jgi:hypothetical protein
MVLMAASQRKKATPEGVAFRKTGAADRNRTGDLLITNQLLYQLSYSSKEAGV